MLIKKSYLFLTLLVAVLVGCSSSNPLIDKAESNLQDQNYQATLEAAKQAIQQYPNNALGYYYKGVALGQIADTKEDPSASAELYRQMNQAFAKAKELASQAEEAPEEIERIDAVKNVLWKGEYVRGVKIFTTDSLRKALENPLQKSVQHLQNAIIIQPDSAVTYTDLSVIAAKNQDYETAVKAKEHWFTMVSDTAAEPSDYLNLAVFYQNLDKQQKVIEVLERGQEQYPTNQQIVSRLADAYSRAGNADKAIATVKELVKQDPENPQYHLVLGTQLYQRALHLSDTLSANREKINNLKQESGSEQQIAQLQQENKQLQEQITQLTKRAEEQLKATLEYRPNDANAYNILGIIYQNKAQAVFEERNRTLDNQKAAELDAQGEELLREALKYYEQAAQIDPDNQNYWRSLFSIYTALGMDQKAKEAMKKAGLE